MSHKRLLPVVLIASAGLVLSSCSQPAGTSGTTTGNSGSSGSTASQPSGSSSTGSSGGGASGTIKNGGILKVALAEAPDALDPTVAQTYVGRIVFANMCEKLYDVGPNLDVVPQLATALPKVSDNGKTWTIKLRKGAKFNDGTPFNAKAVKTTLEHYKTAKRSSRASELADVTSVEVVNPSTVKLHLKKSYAPLLGILADRSGMILSPTQLKKLGSHFEKHPVCVGPFAFKSRPSSDQINLVKSKYYYDKDKVHLAGVQFDVVTQSSVRAANLRSGDYDVVGRLAPPQVESVKGESGVKVKSVTSIGYQGITINVSNSNGAGKPGNHTVDSPLAQHPELRQAFALSLNREAINKAVFDGQYVPGCTPISPNSPYAPDITCPKQDLAKAKQLVKQSGVDTPIPVTLIVEAQNQQAAKLGTVIKSMAQQAGFEVKVQPTEFTTALSQSQAGNFDTFQVGWSGRIDPDQNIQPFWDPTSALNYSGATYPKVSKLLDQEQTATSKDARKQIFQKLCELFLKKNNIIYLYYPTFVLGLASNVTGVKYYGDTLIRLKTAGFTS